MTLNPKVAFLVLGLLVGALLGYMTRPKAAEIKIGDASIEVHDNRVSMGSSPESMTAGQSRHTIEYTLAGGIIGLLIGFAAERRR